MEGSKVPWMHMPLKTFGNAGSAQLGDRVFGAVGGGTRIVAPWPSPMMFRLLVISTACW